MIEKSVRDADGCGFGRVSLAILTHTHTLHLFSSIAGDNNLEGGGCGCLLIIYTHTHDLLFRYSTSYKVNKR